jgi:hypothetical protein
MATFLLSIINVSVFMNHNLADLVLWMKYPANNSSGVGEQVSYTYLNQMLLDTVIGTGTSTYVKNTD